MSGKLKLLYVVTEDWYFVSHRLPLAVAAQAAGFEVAVATRVSIHEATLRTSGIRLVPFALSRRGGNPLREVLALVRLYRRERPDIVHHVALKPVLYGALAARLAGVGSQVHAVAGLGWLFASSGGAARLLRPFVRRALATLLNRHGSITIVQNPDDRALLQRTGIPPSELRLIRGAGVDTELFTPGEAPHGPVLILMASRMLHDKGVGEFVAAARLLHCEGVNARFVLVGDPDPGNPASLDEAQLEAWNGKDGVEYWGRRNDMPAVLQTAHVACLPSFYGEGLPKSLLEAAACGLPIVTTDAPGCREVVRDGDNGFLIPIRDSAALAAALKRLIEDKGLRRRMGERSRERALVEFSQERIIAETLAVYRELRP